MKKITSLSLFLISVCAGLNTAYAVDVYGTHVTGGRLELRFDGFVQRNLVSAQGTMANNFVAGFDWSHGTMNVLTLDMSFSGASYTMSRTYTTGPGQTKTLTAQVNVNPFTIAAANRPTYTLYPDGNGLYSPGYPSGATWGSLPIAGNVVISGPTQSATIPFSVTLPAVAFGPSLQDIDTARYPQGVDLDFYGQYKSDDNEYFQGTWIGTWYDLNGGTYALADALVDGIDVNVKLNSLLPWNSSTYSLSTVPEPFSGMLLLVGLAGWFVSRRAFPRT